MKLPDKIINLIKKTGDKCIIVNPDSDFAVVLMSLKEYERLIGKEEKKKLTGNKELDKINRDIAIWQEKEKEASGENLGNLEEMSRSENSSEEEFYFEPVE